MSAVEIKYKIPVLAIEYTGANWREIKNLIEVHPNDPRDKMPPDFDVGSWVVKIPTFINDKLSFEVKIYQNPHHLFDALFEQV